jgi:hypothetical protein
MDVKTHVGSYDIDSFGTLFVVGTSVSTTYSLIN